MKKEYLAFGTQVIFHDLVWEEPLYLRGLPEEESKAVAMLQQRRVIRHGKEPSTEAMAFQKNVLSILRSQGVSDLRVRGQTKLQAIQIHIPVLQAMRQLYYYVTLLSGKPSFTQFYGVMVLASALKNAVEDDVAGKYCILSEKGVDPSPYIKEAVHDYEDYYGKEFFEIVGLFQEFEAEHREKNKLRNYVKTHNRTSKDHDPVRILYWEIPEYEEDLRNQLWKFCQMKKMELTQPNNAITVLSSYDISVMARLSLEYLDKIISDACRVCTLRLDSINKKTYWVAPTWKAAEYVSLLIEYQGTEDYRRCPMCGALFRVNSQKNKKYCDLHSKSSIRYYRDVLKSKGIATNTKK